jgi:hypothetical protein
MVAVVAAMERTGIEPVTFGLQNPVSGKTDETG